LNYREFVKYLIGCCAEYRYSYLNGLWKGLGEWKAVARSRLRELLSIELSPVFLNPSIDLVYTIDGVSIERISYSLLYGGRAEAFLYVS